MHKARGIRKMKGVRRLTVELNDKEMEWLELLRDGKEHQINSFQSIENMWSKFDMMGILIAQEGQKTYMIVKDNPQIDRQHRTMEVRKEYGA